MEQHASAFLISRHGWEPSYLALHRSGELARRAESPRHYPELNRRLASAEFAAARRYAEEAGLWRFDVRRSYLAYWP